MIGPAAVQRCIFILSMKSCGSSVLQRHIAQLADGRLLASTPHFENETLYWTKAASMLGLPQVPMENSKVPMPRRRAGAMLRDLIRDNAPGYSGRLDSETDFFDAWTALVQAAPGNFVEKSPHHLYQPSVMELMERYADQERAVRVQFIGLVRNPTDMLYSSWRRFGILPEREERHWLRSYSLLRSLRERRPDLVSLVRYEDLVGGRTDLSSLLDVAPANDPSADHQTFHSASIRKWRNDPHFAYSPSAEARHLARSFGYTDEDVVNPSRGPSWLHRVPRAAVFAAFSRLPCTLQERVKSSARMILRAPGAGWELTDRAASA